MGQKSNPIGLRLNQRQSLNCWYADYDYKKQLSLNLRNNAYLENCMQQLKKKGNLLFFSHTRGQIQSNLLINSNEKLPEFPFANIKKNLKTKSHFSDNYNSNNKSAFFNNFKKIDKLTDIKNNTSKDSHYSLAALAGFPFIATRFHNQNNGKVLALHSLKNTFSSPKEKTEIESKRKINKIYHYLGIRRLLLAYHLGILRKDLIVFTPSNHVNIKSRNTFKKSVVNAPKSKIKKKKSQLLDCMQSNVYKNFLANAAHVNVKYKINVFKCFLYYQNPEFIAAILVLNLENGKAFKQIKDTMISHIVKSNSKGDNKMVLGVRLQCSGRVASRSKKAQKARKESIQWGETKLNVFSQRVSFASKSALTRFGKIGIKVWVCYS